MKQHALFIFLCVLASLSTRREADAQTNGTRLESTGVTAMSTRLNDQYTALVSQAANTAKATVDEALFEFSSETLPHEAKDLRKQLVTVRDILDVFSHNFLHELELWNEIRDNLDKGYTVIGDYKDLFDADPKAVEAFAQNRTPKYSDSEKLKDRRKKVLKWKEKYFQPSGIKEQIEELFSNIKPLQTEPMQSRKFSRFFWGGVTELPSEFLNPAENARILATAQAVLAREEHPEVLNIEDLTSHEGEILFHDHRKRLRTIVKICRLANSFSKDSCEQDAIEKLANLVVKLGDIEDLIITGRHFEEVKKKKKAKEAYESAVKKFKKLKSKYSSADMLEPLDRL